MGIAAFGWATGELETQLYGGRDSKKLNRLTDAAARNRVSDVTTRIGQAAASVASGAAVGSTTFSVLDLNGFSSTIRESLADIAGAIVDQSPDVRLGRSEQTRKRTDDLFVVGLVAQAIVTNAKARSPHPLLVEPDRRLLEN